MKHKIGDVVRVRPNLVEGMYGEESFFEDNMGIFCGMCFVVKAIVDGIVNGEYILTYIDKELYTEGDVNFLEFWYWTDEMLEDEV